MLLHSCYVEAVTKFCTMSKWPSQKLHDMCGRSHVAGLMSGGGVEVASSLCDQLGSQNGPVLCPEGQEGGLGLTYAGTLLRDCSLPDLGGTG